MKANLSPARHTRFRSTPAAWLDSTPRALHCHRAEAYSNIAGQPDRADAVFYQQPTIDNILCAGHVPSGRVGVSADQHIVFTPASPVKRSNAMAQSPSAAKCLAAMCGTGSSPAVRIARADSTSSATGRWDAADVNLSARVQKLFKRVGILGARPSCLERTGSHEGGDMGARRRIGVAGLKSNLRSHRMPLSLKRSIAAPRDHERFVIEPKAPVLAQHFGGGVEVVVGGDDLGQAIVFNLRDIDRSVPGSEQRGGAN